MEFFEKDLEQIIFNAKNVDLKKRGLNIPKRLKRQLTIGNYGRLDIAGIELDDYRHCVVTVMELKQKKISVSTFLQAVGYAKGIKRFLNKRKDKRSLSQVYKIRMILIGSEIDNNSTFIYLPGLISGFDFSIEFYTYKYDLDGLKFTSHNNYALSNEGL